MWVGFRYALGPSNSVPGFGVPPETRVRRLGCPKHEKMKERRQKGRERGRREGRKEGRREGGKEGQEGQPSRKKTKTNRQASMGGGSRVWM